MISAWLAAHTQAGEQALRRLIVQPFVSALSIAVIGIAIMLPLGLYVVFENVKAATARLNTEPNINVYLRIGTRDEETRDVENRLKALANTAGIKFVSRESALAEMKRIASVAGLLAGLDGNPLPHAFAIRPKSSDPIALAGMRTEISKISVVETVVMDFEWAQKLKRFANFAELVVGVLALILALAVVFVTGNTARLQMLTQKDEIEVSRLIGATNRFIRRPFLYYGAVQGLIAGAMAISVLFALIWLASREVQALTVSYAFDFSIKYISAQDVIGALSASMALGWIGAYAAVSLYLRVSLNR